jgi:hypothetical protein
MQFPFFPRLCRPLNWMALALLPIAPVACGGSGDASWDGKTYLLDISPLNWISPANIGGDIGDFVPQFLFTVEPGANDELSVLVATAIDGVQDPCNPTSRLTTSAAARPYSMLSASTFPMRLVNPDGPVTVNATIHDLTFTNVLPGGEAGDGQVTATADIAELYPLFTLLANPTKDSVCEELYSFGAPCQTCAFSGQASCLTITAVQIDSTSTSASVVPIAPADIPAACSSN